MLRYFARNSTNSVSGVQSKRTCVSRDGSGFAPCQSQSNCTPGTLSHAASGGNPSESIEPVHRTAVTVFVFGGIPASPVIIEFPQKPHDLATNSLLPRRCLRPCRGGACSARRKTLRDSDRSPL